MTSTSAARASGSPSRGSSSAARILLIEDEPDQRAALTAVLEARGHRVEVATNGVEGLDMAVACNPDVIFLDLGLPDIDGVTLCRHIRVRTSCPIIVVTADVLESRLIEVLDLGADDYILKPYRVDELLARLRVALRHRLALISATRDEVLRCGDVQIDTAARQTRVAGRDLDLLPRQFDLLVALVRNEGKVMTYDVLTRVVWGLERPDEQRFALRTAISKLRSALGVGDDRPSIETEHHIGYRLVAPIA